MIVRINAENLLDHSAKSKMLDARSQEKVKISISTLRVMKSADQQLNGFN
jgi:hypothetical protein